ncbi:MAG: glycosyltransferase family A protein [Candidatus Sulfotelmatobacter sp.]
MPRVTVVIPSYNTASLIAGCLESVFAQTFTDFEAIVVNDGSPDTIELERVLGPYLSRIIYIKQSNKRAAGARNTAIQRARGEFLAFIDSDDAWYPEHLSQQIKLLDDDTALDLVYANSLIVTPHKQWPFMDECPSQGEATFEALVVERCQIPVSTVVARKNAIVKAGLFDETLERCDDYDMWLRTAFQGSKLAYTDRVQARLAGARPGSLGQSNAKMLKAYWDILLKACHTLPLTYSQASLVRRRAAGIKALYFWEEGKVQLYNCQFDKAREFISEANHVLRMPKLELVLLGLKVAPRTTRSLALYWTQL